MKVIFLGRKPTGARALDMLLKRGVEIAAVVGEREADEVFWTPRLCDFARERDLPLLEETALYERAGKGEFTDVDLVISWLYPRKIRAPLLELGRLGAINFHPAPLPDFRGVGGYNVAILDGLPSWGASVHFMDPGLDTGDILAVKRFDIDPDRETAFSLERKTQPVLMELFLETIDLALSGKPLLRTPQGEGRYINHGEFREMKKIRLTDTPEIIERKCRAFWYPPWPGAEIEVNGKTYTLVSPTLLKEISRRYHD